MDAKNSTGDVGNNSTDDVGNNSTCDIDNNSTDDIGDNSTGDVANNPTGDIGDNPTDDVGDIHNICNENQASLPQPHGHIDIDIDTVSNINDTDELGQTQLMKACQENNLRKVAFLVKHGAELDSCDNEHTTAVMHAAKGGFTPIVELLVNEGASKYSGNKKKDFRTVLSVAIEHDHIALANYVTKKYSWRDNTSLDLACQKGCADIVKLLISNGVRVDYYDDDRGSESRRNRTALSYACEYNHPTIAIMLLDNKAETTMDLVDTNGNTSLAYACENNMVQVVDLMLRKNIKRKIAFQCLLTCKNTSCLLKVFKYFVAGRSSFFSKAWSRFRSSRQSFTQDGIRHTTDSTSHTSTSSNSDSNDTMHHSTCQSENNSDRARFVYNCLFNDNRNQSNQIESEGESKSKSKSEGNARVEDSNTLDHPDYKVVFEHIEDFMARMKDVLSTTACEDSTFSCLTLQGCINSGKLGGIKLLFWQDAVDFYKRLPYDPVYGNGYTPLTIALLNGQTHIAEWMQETLNSSAGIVALWLLCKYTKYKRTTESVEFLLKRGVSADIVINNCLTPLFYACRLAHSDIVQCLVDYGADVNKQFMEEGDGKTALITCMHPVDWPPNHKTLECIEILLNNGACLDIVDKSNKTAFNHVIENKYGPSRLKLLVASGKLMTNNNRLKPIHCKRMELQNSYDERNNIIINTIPTLIEYGIFEWTLLPDNMTEGMIRLTIDACISPGWTYNSKTGERNSPLAASFRAKLWPLVLEILDKLYFLHEDYEILKSKSECFTSAATSYLTETAESLSGDVVDAIPIENSQNVKQIVQSRLLDDKPQSLRDVSFLCVSRVISLQHPPCARKTIVERLPLPTAIKNMLLFQ